MTEYKPPLVSEPAFEFLFSGILHWVDAECQRDQKRNKKAAEKLKEKGEENGDGDKKLQKDNRDGENSGESDENSSLSAEDKELENEEDNMMAAEHAAAKMQRLGYDVGYRLVERLAQSKGLAPPSSVNPNDTSVTALSKIQLEAVKFLCKEVWVEVFRKQIDKLQTNHRGVFVLRDREFKWLKRLPGDQNASRVKAIKILAFPCGLIRGVLANLGITTVVSCDFLADGKSMANCSFNIKIKN